MEFVVDQKQIQDLQVRLNKFSTELRNKKILDTISLQIIRNINLRTGAGVDVRYNRFKPYSKVTEEYKKKNNQELTVNLADTRIMRNSMTHKILSNDTAMIFFNGQHKGGFSNASLAKKHNEGLGVPMREFFGLSSRDRTEAFGMYQKEVKRVKENLKL